MYKRLKCVLAIVSLGIILVGRQMNNEEKSPKNETKTSKHVSHQKMTKKQQLAYLKEHEQEIIDYVKSQNNKIESVQIDWSDIRWSKGGNGTPQGGGEGILLFGEINNNSESSWRVDIDSEKGRLDLKNMYLGQPIRIGGKIFE
ncbi:lipoprotein BUG3 [Streptococcus iniae]|nr:lipoprotein BUG3 [Streptococcus iniae]WNZ89744.1 lipoprotein BUG3 [Streptococcus iniae]WNZ91373.1 lipoprotein BUG3 [Streptococcus iniae]WNZ92854.1 lipoprotein BUG3 [Streptococcus iniae]WNZ95831.1 lipoprotein BUG3 [Streptococcus iniae]